MRERLLAQFQNKYDREGWRRTLLEVFGVREINPDPVLIEETEKATGYETGRHVSPDGYEIGVFEYAMKPGRRVDRSRTGLRSLVAGLVRSHVDAALVVFHDDRHWRLSFICDLKDEKTAPKRFTYVFGCPDQSYRTPLERFTALADAEPTFANIYEAFSVERLDKDFFAGYKEMYNLFCGYVPDEKLYRNYVKRMMGRIVFLYFLQKKGWLGGDRNYMTNLLERSKGRCKDTFLSKVLSVLFFDTLNEKRAGDRVNPILGEDVKIPYLNGGLFERDKLDREGMDFPIECFERLLAFFSMYNFTVDENDPNDAEVGVDPEMLGHIFENLLEDNKDKGAYYTPKEVVQYMCREAIYEYLKARTDAGLHDPIRRMLYEGDFEWLRECPAADDIIVLVRGVKVCDPAIGSGVFPMMMLNELYNIRRGFYDCFDTPAPTAYRLKKDIILNNIHGVDLDQGAVDIARLRFWLALVVDDDGQKPLPNLDYKIMQGNSLIESFMGVNLGLFWPMDESKPPLHGKPERDKQGMVSEYFGESDHERKTRLRKDIEQVVREHIGYWSKFRPYVLARYDELDKTDLPFFLWNVYFQDIIEAGGFDIVIGNPPYGAASTPEQKRQYKSEYGTTSRTYGRRGQYKHKGSDDTYSLFIEQGFNLLKQNGILSFIVPMSITSGDSVQGIQTLLLRYCREIKISSYADNPKPVFENANLATSIMSFVKTRTKCEELYMTKMQRRKSGVPLSNLMKDQKFIEAGDYVLRGRLPKISEQIEKDILSKLFDIRPAFRNFIHQNGSAEEAIYYRGAGGGRFEIITNYTTGSSAERVIYFNKHIRNLIGAILSTNFYHWYYEVYSDDRNLKTYEIESFPFPVESFDDELKDKISRAYEEYLADIESHATVRKSKRKNIETVKEYKISLSKAFVDRLDDLICPVYGLTPQETEFVKNYEIEFRVPTDEQV